MISKNKSYITGKCTLKTCFKKWIRFSKSYFNKNRSSTNL